MYKFYLNGICLPTTPESVSIKIKGANKTLNLINEGEINILKSPALTNIELSFLLPSFEYSFLASDVDNNVLMRMLKGLMVNKRPCQFIIKRNGQGQRLKDLNMKVSIEDYSIKESASKGLDTEVSVSLKQFKDYGTKIVKLIDSDKKKTSGIKKEKLRSTENKPNDKSYTVKKGDSLWLISKKMYGDGKQWKKIHSANKSKIKNPNLIYEGQVLNIP